MEFANQLTEQVWTRQNGMCALTAKKFEENSNNDEWFVHFVKPLDQGGEETEDNCVILYKMSDFESKHSPELPLKRIHFPYSNFSDFTAEKIFDELKEDVDSCVRLAEDSSKHRDIQNRLKENQQILRNLDFDDDKKKELFESIESLFSSIQKVFEDNKKEKKQEFEDNYNKIKEKIEAAIKFFDESTDLREAREKLLEVQDEFKRTRLENEQQRELFEVINKTFERLYIRQNEEREAFEMECIENYHNLKSTVDDAVQFANSSNEFRRIRQKLIAAQQKFKGLRLLRNQREELYTKIQDAFEELNKRQDEDREQFDDECNANYEMLSPNVEKAIKFADNCTDFKQARENLISAQALIKGTRLTKNQRDKLYGDIRASFEELNIRQGREREDFEKEASDNYAKLREKLNEVEKTINPTNDFRQIRDILIAIQNDVKILKLKRTQRNELFQSIRDSFAKLDDLRGEYRENKKEEKSKKLGSILANLQARIKWIEDSIAKDRKEIEDEAAKMNDPANNYEVQREAEEAISAIEFRIREKENNIRETNERIQDIEKEIDS